MFLKISPDLDMPLTSLDTKNYCPRLNGLGDIAIIANPIFFWDTLYSNKCTSIIVNFVYNVQGVPKKMGLAIISISPNFST